MTLVSAVLLIALILGLVANQSLRPFFMSDDEGSSIADLLSPLAVLAALFIGLVLADVSTSYSSARESVAREAKLVDNLFETTEYLPNPTRGAMQASIVCYARAVAGPEWETMARGQGSLNRVPSNYTGTGPLGLRRMFIELGPSDPLWEKLTSADAERGDARRDRLAQARPSVPGIVSVFMLVLVGLTIAGLGFSIPRAHNLPHVIILIVVVVLTGASLLLIRSLDRPFGGVLAIKRTEMLTTAQQVTDDYNESYPGTPPPCDDEGRPTPTTGTTTTPPVTPTTRS